MILKLEALTGDNIEHCFHESVKVAALLGITVEFVFNGVTCSVHKANNSLDKLWNGYMAALKPDVKFKYASA